MCRIHVKENCMDLTMQNVSRKRYTLHPVCEGDRECRDGFPKYLELFREKSSKSVQATLQIKLKRISARRCFPGILKWWTIHRTFWNTMEIILRTIFEDFYDTGQFFRYYRIFLSVMYYLDFHKCY